jgi:hypothetical protein
VDPGEPEAAPRPAAVPATSAEETQWPDEPPLPAPYAPVDPPLPPVPKHTAPARSLWAGVKVGWAFPLGDLWLDGSHTLNGVYVLERRSFADFASSGPKTELDVGVRLARRYNVLAHWEYVNLGEGRLLSDELGGQRGHMNYVGLGFRFSSDPDDVGVLVEAVVGYRNFVTKFDNGAALRASDDFLNTRLSFGADIRLSPLFSLSPMVGIAGGFFEEVEWTFADGTKSNARSSFDDYSQHTVVTLDVGAHFDLLPSEH